MNNNSRPCRNNCVPWYREGRHRPRTAWRRFYAIVKGERSVTADTALRLVRFFSTSPEFWVNLQAMRDLTKARQESGETIERDVHPRAA